MINYEVYRYRYTDFLNLDGVLVIEEQNEFREHVSRLRSEPGELGRLRECQKSVAPRWGFLDGRCYGCASWRSCKNTVADAKWIARP